MNTHPLVLLDVPVHMKCNANLPLPIHTMPHMPTHAYQPMHQLDIYIIEHINSNLNHTIHANIPNTHTLTSTSHHQSSDDLLYPLGLIVIPYPQIAYNQAMQWPPSYTNSCISLSLMDNYINMHIITKQHTPISMY